MGKKLAAVGLAAAIGVGGLVGAAVNPLVTASAQDTPSTTTTAPSTETGGRQGPLKRALAALVADGTITQEQADAVVDATAAEVDTAQAGRQARRAATLEVIATALGSTADEVKTALRSGTSIAAQAEAKGIDRQTVDDALTAHLNATIDASVADGTITEDRAARAREHVDQAVDRILDADGTGGGRLRDRFQGDLGD